MRDNLGSLCVCVCVCERERETVCLSVHILFEDEVHAPIILDKSVDDSIVKILFSFMSCSFLIDMRARDESLPCAVPLWL